MSVVIQQNGTCINLPIIQLQQWAGSEPYYVDLCSTEEELKDICIHTTLTYENNVSQAHTIAPSLSYCSKLSVLSLQQYLCFDIYCHIVLASPSFDRSSLSFNISNTAAPKESSLVVFGASNPESVLKTSFYPDGMSNSPTSVHFPVKFHNFEDFIKEIVLFFQICC